MKKNIKILLIIISLFFINMGIVKANCEGGTFVPLCSYSYKNSDTEKTDIIRISACMQNSNMSYFTLNVENGKSQFTVAQYRNIMFFDTIPETGTVHIKGNNQAMTTVSSTIKDLYISRYAMSDLIKARTNYDKNGKSSSYCPKKLSTNKKVTKIAISKSDKYIDDFKSKNSGKFRDYAIEEKATVGMSDDRLDKVAESNEGLGLNYSSSKSKNENGNITISEASCDSLLGSVDNPDEPAYYLELAFTIIKYVAIIILIVFSMKDFAMAIVKKDEEAVKNATASSVKRLVYCVIIFVLPILVKLILNWSHIVSTNPLCGIGGA